MNRGEAIQVYFLRMTKFKNQWSTIGEVVPEKEMVLIVLRDLFSIWETFIININNIKTIPTFDELLGKCIQGEAKMIFRGNISHHEEEEPTAFSAYDKRNKGNKNKYAFKSNKGNLDMSKVRCFNYQK